MDLVKACNQTESGFIYKVTSRWYFMTRAPKKGDCVNWSLTVIYTYFGGWIAALKALISGKAVMHHVLSKGENGKWVNHAVGQIGGYWFDNFTKRPLQHDEFFAEHGHRYQHQRSVAFVLFKLAIGNYWSAGALLVTVIGALTYGLTLIH